MKVWFKRVLFSLVVVAIVAFVGIAIFLLTFDPNAYKNQLEEYVYDRYQRTLAIKGNIELSLFPRIGLAVQDVSLSNRKSPDTFASIDSARFAVAIWPLMTNRFVVDHVAMTGFRAWIKRDEKGRFNFGDLLSSAAPGLADNGAGKSAGVSPLSIAAAQTVENTDFDIDIAGLTLKNGEIHLHDSKSGAVARLEKLDIDTGRVTFNQPFDVAFKGRLSGDYPKADAAVSGQGLFRLNPRDRIYSAQKLSLQANGSLGPLTAKTATVRGNLAYHAMTQLLNVSNLEVLVQGDVAGDKPIAGLDTSLTVPSLRMDRSQAELQMEKVAYRAKGKRGKEDFDLAVDAPRLAISPESAKGEPVQATAKFSEGAKVQGISLNMNGLGGNASQLTLKELKFESGFKDGDRLVQLNMSSPATWDVFRKVGGLSAMKGDIRIDDPGLPGGNFQFPFIGSLQADLIKDFFETGLDAVLSGSKLNFRLTGTQLSDPRLSFAFKADKLDFNTLFPPAPPKPAAAPPADKPAEPAKAGAKAAAKPAPAKAAPASVDMPNLSFLNALNLTGTIEIGALKIKELQASAVKAAVEARDGKLAVNAISANLYDGLLSGRLRAAADNTMGANLVLGNIALRPFLHDYAREDRLSGKGTVMIDVASAGRTAAAVEAGLSGSVRLQVGDGSVQGLDFLQTMGEANEVVRNVFSGQLPAIMSQLDKARKTDFTSVEADISFTQGQGTVTRLDLAAPGLRVTQGVPASIDLVNDQADIVLMVKLADGLDPQRAQALKDWLGVAVPLRLSGPFGRLGYHVQWKDIDSEPIRQAVREGLVDILAVPPVPAADEPAPDTKPANAVKSISDTIKGLLGQ